MTDKIDALKTLHTRLIDSHDGYEKAKEDAASSSHKQLFDEMADRRSRNHAQVHQFLVAKGVEPDEGGSFLASAHRTLVDLRSVFSKGDDAVLAEVVRGEENLLEAYDEAIKVCGGNDPEYAFLTEQYTELKSKVDQLKGQQKTAA